MLRSWNSSRTIVWKPESSGSIEADLPADFAAERPATLARDARGNGPRRHAARLEQDHRSVVHERRRDARRLAGAGRGGHDGRARSTHVRNDASEIGVDGERNQSVKS